MLTLHLGCLSPAWSEFVGSLLADLEPLGHRLQKDDTGTTLLIQEPWTRQDEGWDHLHRQRHRAHLTAHRDAILAFERDYAPLFVDRATFQPTAVRPVLQVVDFKNPDHTRVLDYLRLSQSVTAGRQVGRRMGLLIWDVGQTGGPRLFGGAQLSSARFSQRLRDQHLAWPPDFPKTSPRHDLAARALRVGGLNRIMQLSIACAVNPYAQLSGAWLAALAPFTDAGVDAFRRSLKLPDGDADLAAIVTTTGKGRSGSPFRNHRVVQLAPGVGAAPGAKGNLYTRLSAGPRTPPLRASFESLVSARTRGLAVALFQAERPERFAALPRPERSAMAYGLRRCRLRRWIYQGNEIGVHLGALGTATLDSLQTGRARSMGARPVLAWDRAVGVWSRRFLPAPETVGESADEASQTPHRLARQARLQSSRDLPEDQYRLSWLLENAPGRDEGG